MAVKTPLIKRSPTFVSGRHNFSTAHWLEAETFGDNVILGIGSNAEPTSAIFTLAALNELIDVLEQIRAAHFKVA